MSILTHYTLRCLKQNRVRTLVTVIGIILSVALFTAVAEGAYSGRQYLIDVTIAQEGAYHGYFEGLEDGGVEQLIAMDGVAQVETLTDVGWAMVGDSDRADPYLRIVSMSADFPELVTVRLKEGRMPQNDHELLVSDTAGSYTGTAFQVGQELQLSVGQREDAEGNVLDDYNSYMGEDEHLTNVRDGSYTVVGIYDSFSYRMPMPATLALTVGAEGPNYMAFFTLDDVKDTVHFLMGGPTHSLHRINDGYNWDLISYAGAGEDANMNTVLYGLVTILFALIFLGSVALIYNSFSISVSERTKQFGLLKSIGATNRQLRRTVMIEALLLCVVGIPLGLLVGCGGIGLTLRLLQPSFRELINVDGAEQIDIRLVLHLPSLGIAAGIGLLTALVSAWIPAKRATRLSPISAIRQSTDVRIRAKQIRVSRLTGWLFGFPGTLAAKNFKRSRKQYRSTVISLFLSIVLFISAWSFSAHLRNNVAENIFEQPADVIVYMDRAAAFADVSEREAVLQKLLSTKYVTGGTYSINFGYDAALPPEAVPADVRELASDAELQSFYFSVYYLRDEDYNALCRQNGLDPADGQALAYVDGTVIVDDAEDGSYRMRVSLLKRDALPLQLELRREREQFQNDYMLVVQDEPDENGKLRNGYIRLEDYNNDGSYDESKLVYFSEDEVYEKTQLTVGALLKELPLASLGKESALYIPLSQLPEHLNADVELHGVRQFRLKYYLNATDHAKAYEELTQLFTALNGGSDDDFTVRDTRENNESVKALLLVLDVFTFGFIILISLIAAANVFNTISTNVALRRREFATLKSVGMGNKAFGRMMRFECLLYGTKALLWGLPVSVGISWLIWKVINQSFRNGAFRLPWTAMAIAAGSVFLVVFATMLYATGKIKKDNPIDALKQETL